MAKWDLPYPPVPHPLRTKVLFFTDPTPTLRQNMWPDASTACLVRPAVGLSIQHKKHPDLEAPRLCSSYWPIPTLPHRSSSHRYMATQKLGTPMMYNCP